LRDKFGPEVVIKMQIQQGAVEIEKYRVNLCPINHGRRGCICVSGYGRNALGVAVGDILAPSAVARIFSRVLA
jgi:hypothetical protein